MRAAERLACVAFAAYDNAQAGIVAVPAHRALRNACVYECMCVISRQVCGAYVRTIGARTRGSDVGAGGTMCSSPCRVRRSVSCGVWARCSPAGDDTPNNVELHLTMK